MESSDLKFNLGVFEGPLDLLLHLIKTNELDISEISISKITNQFLEIVRLMEHLDLEAAGDYLVMAASLINIKLRALLPDTEEEAEGEEGANELDDFMSAKLLMQRLIEYRRFKEAAGRLGRQAERQSQIFMRDVALPKLVEAERDPEIEGDLNLLLKAFARVIRFVDRRDYHEVQSEEFTIEQKTTMLRRRLVVDERISLIEIFENCRNKVEMIVTLIAVLELTRLKELRVVQGDCFDAVILLARKAGKDEDNEETLAEQARETQALEADIIAHRTGLVDDGIIPDEDADALPGETEPSDNRARIIDLAGGEGEEPMP